MQKTIFITGASSGLGKATAILFQQQGWKVIATMRNPEKETELNQLENVTLLALDVTDPAQIKVAVSQATALRDIDVVFNNAGYGLMAPLEALTDEQMMKQLNTNLIGVLRITKAFIPHFREKGSGLFITTTSIGGLFGFPLHSIYNAAKFAIEGWSESMSFELGTLGIGIKTIAAGAITTDFLGRSLERYSHPAYQATEDKLFSTIDSMMAAGSTPEAIASVVFEAATDGKDQVRYMAGPDAEAIAARRVELGNEAFRKEIRTNVLG